MATTESLLDRVEALRIPLDAPAAPADWKDWYHFVLFDPATRLRALVNVSLAGNLADGEIQVTVLVTRDASDRTAVTHGFARSRPWQPGQVTAAPLAIDSDRLRLAFNGSRFVLSLDDPDSRIAIDLVATPEGPPLLVTESSTFGSGFIGWGLVPALHVTGSLSVCGEVRRVDPSWYCYQDHNFGRFRWGEDFGWVWLVAHAREPDGRAITVVLDLRTDRAHRARGLPYLFVHVDGRLGKVFLGPALRIDWAFSPGARLPARLPGALASLWGDRTVRTPVALSVRARDERDACSIDVVIDAHTEILVPDTLQNRASRIGECAGTTTIRYVREERVVEAAGLAYAEYTQ